MKKSILAVVLAITSLVSYGQIQTPAASPAGSVSTVVGLTEIKVEYFRPRAKGRVIFGNDPKAVVPYGKLWRTGANGGTKVSFSDDVTVEGVAVPKGEYLIFTWPGEKEWTVSLYKDVKLGGNTEKYDKSQEAANFKVKPVKLADKVETFTISIGEIADDNKSAKVMLAWANTGIKFNVGVTYDEKVVKLIDETLSSDKAQPYDYFQAAVYYLETGRDLKKALEWVNKAAEGMDSPFWVLHQKAKIQKALGDKSGAKATATASLEKAKQANNRDYQMMNEDLIKSL